MELRRLGEPLLRSRPSPLLSFLAPTIPQSWRPTTAPRRIRRLNTGCPKVLRCSFHSTACQGAEKPSSSTAADLDFLEDDTRQSPLRPSSERGRYSSDNTRPNRDASDKIDDLLNSTLDIPKLKGRQAPTPPQESSAEVLRQARKASEYYTLREQGARAPGSLSRAMKFPEPSSRSGFEDPYAIVDGYQSRKPIPVGKAVRSKRTIRSRPSVGRTIEIDQDRGINFGSALRTLEIQCNVNRVRQDLSKQRFHERAGLKKKRLKSERWRKLFRDSFRATVGRVKEMRRKGW